MLRTKVKSEEKYENAEVFELVDGQQRATVSTILMCLIRDRMKTHKNKDQASKIHQNCIIQLDRHLTEDLYFRLTIGKEGREYFEETILAFRPKDTVPCTSQEKLLKKAKDHLNNKLDDYLKDLDDMSAVEKLSELKIKLSDLIVVVVDVDDDDTKFEIFQSINATGMDLSQSDLIKNTLIQNINKEKDKIKLSETFAELLCESEETPLNLTNIIRYMFIGKYRFCTEKELCKEIEKMIKDPKYRPIHKDLSKKDFIDQLIKDITNAVSSIKSLTVGSVDFKDEFGQKDKPRIKYSQSIQLLRQSNVKQHLVIFLAIHNSISEYESKADIAKTAELIAKFCIVFFGVLSTSGNKIERFLAEQARKINKAAVIENAKKRENELKSKYANFIKKLKKDKWPTNSFIKEGLNDIQYEPKKGPRSVLRCLFGLLQFQRENPEFYLDWDNLNIEHLYPQNPTGFKIENGVKEVIDSLGNLCLINKYKNAEMSNAHPREKVEPLKDSQLDEVKKVAKKIEQAGTHGATEIKARTEQLNEELFNILKKKYLI